ncbi:hypothetical protein AB9P05_01435 [Roseivirga sp. BDSF3-8]|uniref:hypothetical protein n=1 Tax=Roseivirga sp. BDSF3-8 TaxID=3241598 RepID=UPI00353258F7
MVRISTFIALALLLILQGSACTTGMTFNEWVGWKKYRDAPGISYRLRCLGSSFTGSRFSRYEVELFNHYPDPVALSFFMKGMEEKERSEIVNLKIQSSTLRKVNLYNVRTGCVDSASIYIEDMVFRP